jgi:hypothetical protein
MTLHPAALSSVALGPLHRSVVTSLTKVNADSPRRSAEIAIFPKAKIPAQVVEFDKACARLVSATFAGGSQSAVCKAARDATGASEDTFERILGCKTKHIDMKLMFVVLAMHQAKTGNAFPIGGGFEIAITQAGQQ